MSSTFDQEVCQAWAAAADHPGLFRTSFGDFQFKPVPGSFGFEASFNPAHWAAKRKEGPGGGPAVDPGAAVVPVEAVFEPSRFNFNKISPDERLFRLDLDRPAHELELLAPTPATGGGVSGARRPAHRVRASRGLPMRRRGGGRPPCGLMIPSKRRRHSSWQPCRSCNPTEPPSEYQKKGQTAATRSSASPHPTIFRAFSAQKSLNALSQWQCALYSGTGHWNEVQFDASQWNPP